MGAQGVDQKVPSKLTGTREWFGSRTTVEDLFDTPGGG